MSNQQTSSAPPNTYPHISGMSAPMMIPSGMPLGMVPPQGFGGVPFQGQPFPNGMMHPYHGMIQPGMQMGGPMIPMRPQKVFFPHEIQIFFKERNIGFLKSKSKPKCRNLDPLTSHNTWEYICSKFEKGPPPQREKQEIPEDKKVREKKEKQNQVKEAIQEKMQNWNPFEDENATGDPYKTLIISNLSYNINETKLKDHFKKYGPVKNVRIIRNLNQKHRGYGFVEFERNIDFTIAYKNSHGTRIDGRRISVDIERGRTVLKFRPRRFGYGLGETRKRKSPSKSSERRAHSSDSEGEYEKRDRKQRRQSSSENNRYRLSNNFRERSRSNNIKRILSRSPSEIRTRSPFRQRSNSPVQPMGSPQRNKSPLRQASPQRKVNDFSLRRNSNSPLRRQNKENKRGEWSSPQNEVPPMKKAQSPSPLREREKKAKRERSRSLTKRNGDDEKKFRRNEEENQEQVHEKKEKKSKKSSRKHAKNEEEGEVQDEEDDQHNQERVQKKQKKKDAKEEKSKKEKKSKKGER